MVKQYVIQFIAVRVWPKGNQYYLEMLLLHDIVVNTFPTNRDLKYLADPFNFRKYEYICIIMSEIV